MGFLDKAKEQASALANKAQEGINQGQEKLSDAQAARNAKGLLEELGTWTWAKEHGRQTELAETELARVRADLAAHEAEHGPIDPPSVQATSGVQGAAPSMPPPSAPPGSPDGPPPPPPPGEAPPPPA